MTLPIRRTPWTVMLRAGAAMFVLVVVFGIGGCSHAASIARTRSSGSDSDRGFAFIVAGSGNSCGIDGAGRAYCWGGNYFGEAGHGGESETCGSYYPSQYCLKQPTAVAGGLRFASIAPGLLHTCGLTTDGDAYCWGQFDTALGSEAGNGCATRGYHAPPCPTRPLAVSGGLKFRSITAGGDLSCGVSTESYAYCWGSNDAGQLGSGSAGRGTDVRVPQAVAGGHRFSAVLAGGAFACGLTESGEVLCWGSNGSGQLGAGSVDSLPHPEPRRVGLDGRYTTLAVGAHHACALAAGGQAFCWGANAAGQLGDGSRETRAAPVEVADAPHLAALRAGEAQTCGLTRDGRLYCWGGNLVDSALDERRSTGCDSGTTFRCTLYPTWIHRAYRWRDVSIGRSHGCGLTRDAASLCWGDNARAELGQGHEHTVIPTPVRIANAPAFAALADRLSPSTACGVDSAGRAFCWGSGMYGARGDGADWLAGPAGVPRAVAGTAGFQRVALYGGRGCGQTPEGEVWCWGGNYDRSLLTGDTASNLLAPVRVPLPVPLAAGTLTVGEQYACALTPAGQAYCWGGNRSGQLGRRHADTLVHAPAPVHAAAAFASIRAGTEHTCALTPDGQAYCWGAGGRGELGAAPPEWCGGLDGGARDPCSTAPVLAATPVRFRQVEVGHGYTCGLSIAGEPFCWGNGVGARLGRNVAAACGGADEWPGGCSTQPLRVDRAPALEEIVLGDAHVCGLERSGRAYCWGADNDGQLGAPGSRAECKGDEASVFPCRARPHPVQTPARFRDLSAGALYSCGLERETGQVYCWGRNDSAQLGVVGGLPLPVSPPPAPVRTGPGT